MKELDRENLSEASSEWRRSQLASVSTCSRDGVIETRRRSIKESVSDINAGPSLVACLPISVLSFFQVKCDVTSGRMN